MKVTLVNVGPYIPGIAASPPLGVMSLAAWVRSKIPNLRLRIIDQYIERHTYDGLAAELVRDSPNVLALSYMSLAASHVPRLVEAIKKALPETLVVLGGPHPSAALSEGLACTRADASVIGEGEVAFEMILDACASGSDLAGVPGIYRQEGGEVLLNPGTSPSVPDLDDLPFPAYDLIPIEKYWGATSMSILSPGHQYISMSTSRGCPYRCIYCHEVFGKSFRAQSPARVIDEIQYFQKRYNNREFYFVDDIFNLDRKRVIALSEMVTSRNIQFRMHMPNGIRTDILTQEVVDAMTDMGLRTCAFALESGSKRIQKLIKKNLNIPKFLKGVEMMAKKRVYSYGFNILGFPTETPEEMRQTIDTAAKSMLHRACFFKATPYPGTGLYEAAREICPDKLPEMDYMHFDYSTNHSVNFSAASDDELLRLLRLAPRVFNRNPGRLYRVWRDFPEDSRVGKLLESPVNAVTKLLGYRVSSVKRTRLGHEVV